MKIAVNSQTGDVTDQVLSALASGESVSIPRGEFTFSEKITLSGDQSIQGSGRAGTVLRKTFNGVGIEGTGVAWGLRDLTVTSDGTDSGNTAADGIVATGARWSIENVRSTGHGGNGLNIAEGNLAQVDRYEGTSNGQHGLLTGGPDANALTFINLDLRGNTLSGFKNHGSYAATVIGGYASGNGEYGWLIDNDRGAYLGIGGEANTGVDVYLGTNADYNFVLLAKGIHDGVAGIADGNTVIRQGQDGVFALRLGEIIAKSFKFNTHGVSGAYAFSVDATTSNPTLTKTGTGAARDLDISSIGNGRGVIVKDVAGNPYRISVVSGSVVATAL